MTDVTTIDEAREDIFQRVVDNWTSSVYVFQGEDVKTFVEGTASFVHWMVDELSSERVCISGARFKRTNRLTAEIYTPQNAGTSEAATLGEAARTLFEGVAFSGMDFIDGVRVIDIPTEKGSKWQRTNAVAVFVYEVSK